MLAEGFVQLLHMKEEKLPSTSDGQRRRTHSSSLKSQTCNLELFGDKPEPGPQRACSPIKAPSPAPAVGLSIPRSSSIHTVETVLSSCSLLDQYPDLQVGDFGLIPSKPVRVNMDVYLEPSDLGPAMVNPDQGYLVMGTNSYTSLGLPSSQLEPMSNSLLNGLLDQQLEEVYLQHLTDNLARCNSHLGNSLLHELVPPPKPSADSQRIDSLEVCLNEVESKRPLTQQSIPCSSNFSSPVLRISESENNH